MTSAMPFESGAAHRVRRGVALDVGCAVGGASFELTGTSATWSAST